ncbi:Zinc transport protein ZntB [Vibrio thalassae]|uniref:Zinc transport protein ZntB n=1 Tax=Vibrio thalassae TaxID=1243014 RepID=A0A240ENC7_9VIBR|nr:CorA family divalent cation transporter [Vibrio thalassae]SNX49659.1 Zinc transport protein ZntB [Vibrio thalassae]
MPVITPLNAQHVEGHQGKEQPCWIDLDLSKEEDHHWLTKESGLAEDLINFLLRKNFVNHRNLHDGSVLVALMISNEKPVTQSLGLIDLKIFFDTSRIITVRYHPVSAIDRTYSQLLINNDAQSNVRVVDVFKAIVKNLIVYIEKITFTMSDQLAVIEDRYFDSQDEFDAELLLKLRGDICKIRRILTVLRNALLIRMEDATLNLEKEDRTALLRSSNHVSLNIDNLDDLINRIDVLQNLDNANRAEVMSESSFRLTIVATVFLPMTFVSGLLGMNVGGIPETHSPWGFWGITVSMILLAIGLWVYLYRHLQSMRIRR